MAELLTLALDLLEEERDLAEVVGSWAATGELFTEREVTLVLLFMENTAAFKVFLSVQTQFKQKRNPGEMAESIALPRQHELGGHLPSCKSVFLLFTSTFFFFFHF